MLGHFPILRERIEQPAGTLSCGEQQVLAIGRALMSRPQVLPLDELHASTSPLPRHLDRSTRGSCHSTERRSASTRTDAPRAVLDLPRGATVTSHRVEIHPGVMMGKPVIRGTRVPVELILRKLSEGATEADILDAHPRLTREDVRAALAYAADALAHEVVHALDHG